MKAAAIFPVGTSTGGAPDAIRLILETESALDVYLLPGKPGDPGTADPKLSIQQIRNEISHPGVNWIICEAVEPFDVSETYGQIRERIARIADHDYERVYVGITGGSNPMIASLFQLAMTYLRAQVVPLYVQGQGAVWQRNFVASDIRDRVTAEEALRTARSGQIRVAARLGEPLPPVNPWKFLRDSLSALSYWDDFDYSQASQGLEHAARKSRDYSSDELLAPVADTVARIAANAARITDFTKQIRDVQNFDPVATAPEWAQRVDEVGILLVADALANANRRIVEGRYTDSVLRSYRAAECATQMRLLARGIHPARDELAFRAGLQRLESEGQFDSAPIEKSIRALADFRNHTYLEHGYRRVQKGQSEQCLTWALDICETLLGPAIRQKWRQFEMRF